MDITNITLIISIPLQCIAMLWINSFWLNFKVSKRELIIFVVGVLLPTMILFSLAGAFSSVYLMFSLILFLYKISYKKIVILNVLVSFLIAVITDHIVSLIFLLFFPTFFSEIIFIILRNLLFGLLLAAEAFVYKKLLYYLLDKYMIFKKGFYLLIGLFFISLLFFYLNIFMMANKNSLDNIQFNLSIFSIYFFSY